MQQVCGGFGFICDIFLQANIPLYDMIQLKLSVRVNTFLLKVQTWCGRTREEGEVVSTLLFIESVKKCSIYPINDYLKTQIWEFLFAYKIC